MRFITLGIALSCFWLVLSGHYSLDIKHPLVAKLGVVSVALCLLLAYKMRTADEEGHPIQLLFGAITYMPWLVLEIIKSAIHVSSVILSPRLPISPSMFKTKASQKTPVGINIYGNSITLTPGTMTVGVSGNELEIHALTKDTAADVKSGGMDKRVREFEGAK